MYLIISYFLIDATSIEYDYYIRKEEVNIGYEIIFLRLYKAPLPARIEQALTRGR